MNMEKLIIPIVNEILTRLNKKVIIFISGGNVNLEPLINNLSNFQLMNYYIVLSESAKEIIDMKLLDKLQGNLVQSVEQLNTLLKECQLVLIPVMSRNTLSKTAIGISDNIVTTGISRAIMLNKEIIVVRDSYDPKNNINISEGLTNNLLYNSMLLNYEKILENFGVKFINSYELTSTVEKNLNGTNIDFLPEKKERIYDEKTNIKYKFEDSILTLTDIKKFSAFKEIVIKKDTIITHLAKDYIYNNNIKIEFY